MLLLDRLGTRASERYTSSGRGIRRAFCQYRPRISATDFLLVYLIPVAALFVAWLAFTLGLLALVHSPLRSDFKEDVLFRYEFKRQRAAWAHLKLSFPYLARMTAGDITLWATFLYRVSRFLVRHRMTPLAQGVHLVAKVLTHADLNPKCDIAPGFYLWHGLGTVIGKGSVIGRRAIVLQGVTIGGGRAHIGEDVKIWAGAKVIGNVDIGDRCTIGANAVVISDVPADTTAVGVPAKRYIPKNPGGSV